MNPLTCPPDLMPTPADRWVRRGAWALVLGLMSALLWLGLSYGPAMAEPLPVPNTDTVSARSNR